MSLPPSERRDFIREMIADDLASGKHTAPVTRFPPEPNGYLHIGHAKSICLNFGIARDYASIGGRCHLRFDDTNPSKEDQEYVDSIESDIRWLGFDWGENLYFASNIFDFFHECATSLIQQGLAYVDEQNVEAIRAQRGNLTTPGQASPFRDRSVAENLEAFDRMKAGKFEEGKAVLRAKIDMASPNMNMRDPVIYRIMFADHHNTGSKWCIYPMYDFAHPLEDAFEHITHSLCTLEFENHRPLYEWVIDHCPVPSHPRQTEFARLNLTYTVMSKRKLLQLVQEKRVTGWDDPRMPTVSGMRRRGYTPEAIRNFCQTIGITKFNGFTDVALLEYSVREDLNAKAPRRMAVLNPLKVTIRSFSEDFAESIEVQNNPERAEDGTRLVPLTREVWIERDDFMDDPPKKYFRLGPGRTVRLRGGYCITCVDVVRDDQGDVTELICEHIPGTIGSNPPEGVQCRAAIQWVSVQHAVDGEIRLYDRLFTVENPDAVEEGFLSVMNENSMSVIANAKLEPSLANVPAEYHCQFERIGYFVSDRKDHIPGQRVVFNRAVALKDSWAKKQK
ncbi:MAG: glutamine--tRNA ligase/YqeY domain fusion protein [Akkermansia sp.]